MTEIDHNPRIIDTVVLCLLAALVVVFAAALMSHLGLRFPPSN